MQQRARGDMTRIIYIFSALALLFAACGTNSRDDMADAIRRMQQSGAPAAPPAPPSSSSPAVRRDPAGSPTLSTLQLQATRDAELLKRANEGGDPMEIASATAALTRSRTALQTEQQRLSRVAEMRARTPDRVIPVKEQVVREQPSSSPAKSPAREAAAAEPLPFSEETATSRPDARVAPVPTGTTAPARRVSFINDDDEFEYLTQRIGWLAGLRSSTGDGQGAVRLRQRTAAWRTQYKSGNSKKALDELRRIEQEAYK